MPEHSKIFTYEIDGLSYMVTVFEQNGEILADITVTEGAMDVNAIYFGDDDYSGASESLGGPLNMNGARLDSERVQWDDAVALSDPGLGPEGEDKETFISAGDTLTVSLGVGSLEDIDVFGIRATSTTNDAGSIKGVSDNPEEPEDPTDAVYEKVFFGELFSDSGAPLGGTFILSEEPDPNTFDIPSLPEGTEPTFENYLNYFETIGGDVTALDAVVFYETAEEGDLEEVFRIDAPEDGFENSEELLAAYDDAASLLEELEGGDPGSDLIAALSIEPEPEVVENDVQEEEFEDVF